MAEELLACLSKFTSIILFVKRNKLLLEKFNDGYRKFVWILNRINRKDYKLKIKNFKIFKDKVESLIALIKSMNLYFEDAEINLFFKRITFNPDNNFRVFKTIRG